MRHLLAILILFSLVFTPVSPAFAQDGSGTDSPTDTNPIFLPLVVENGARVVPSETLPPPIPATPEPPREREDQGRELNMAALTMTTVNTNTVPHYFGP